MASANLNKNRYPYRPPCSGKWTGKYYLPRRDHFRASENNIPFYKNITQILNHCTPAQRQAPGAITDCGQTGGVADSCTTPCATGCTYLPAPCGGAVTFGNNCYQATGGVINRAQCYKLGFKNVQAFKLWQGSPGFPVETASNATPCDCYSYPPYAPAPHGVRYLQCDVSVVATFESDATYTCGGGGSFATHFSQTSTYSRTININRYTGNVTISNCVDNLVTDAYYVGGVDCGSVCYPGTTNSCVTGIPNPCGDPNTVVQYNCTQTPSAAGTAALATPSCFAPFNGHVIDPTYGEGTIVITVSPTSYHYTFTPDTFFAGGWSISVTLTLSQPYSSDDVQADTEALLAEWDLTNDAAYPWRTDTGVSKAPLVTRDEWGPNDPFAYATSPCGTTGTATGNIIGAPTPAGFGPYWNCAQPNYGDDGSGNLVVLSWGGWSPAWCPQATQWTNDLYATGLYGGAYTGITGSNGNFPFVVQAGPDIDPIGIYEGGCFKQKWAEIILFVKPSHNFARPCGPADRAAIDQTTIDCVHNPGGNLRWPNAPCNCDDPANPGPAAPAPCPPNNPSALDAWNDTGIKGDFVLRDFSYDARGPGEYYRLQAIIAAWNTGSCGAAPSLPSLPRAGATLSNIVCTQSCLTYTSCCPAIVCYTPNGEKPTGGLALGLPRVTLDDTYGTFDYHDIVQWMADFLFQPPHSPDCAGNNWAADNGTCQPCTESDTPTCYYQVPYEEARCLVPAGAPALPAGITPLGATNIGGTWTGNMIAQPYIGGSNYFSVWNYWLNQITTCCDPGEDCEMPPP
jgi:hypothetical protein